MVSWVSSRSGALAHGQLGNSRSGALAHGQLGKLKVRCISSWPAGLAQGQVR